LATVEDADAIARTHVASWRATYPGIVPQVYLDSLSVEERAERWRSALIASTGMKIYVAECSEMICGFASGGPARAEITGFSGELYAIYLNPDVQRRGIGSQLFWAIVEDLHSSGHRGMYVWVLKDNPSRGFYERMGGSLLTAAEIEIGGKTLTEVSYGWQDLSLVVKDLPQC
jgi:GNAT superfamily N-acetyltransferase